jgi:hypothetical protein
MICGLFIKIKPIKMKTASNLYHRRSYPVAVLQQEAYISAMEFKKLPAL